MRIRQTLRIAALGAVLCLGGRAMAVGLTLDAATAEVAPDTLGLRLQALSGNARVEQAAAVMERMAGGMAGLATSGHGILSASGSTADSAVLLPFFDDFTYEGPYPDPDLWADRSVFVNNTYAFYPPTYGVATFDAMDSEGALYRHGGLGVSFSADTLTSRPIRLIRFLIRRRVR